MIDDGNSRSIIANSCVDAISRNRGSNPCWFIVVVLAELCNENWPKYLLLSRTQRLHFLDNVGIIVYEAAYTILTAI